MYNLNNRKLYGKGMDESDYHYKCMNAALADYTNWGISADSTGEVCYYKPTPEYRIKSVLADQYPFEKIPPNYSFLKQDMDFSRNILCHHFKLMCNDIVITTIPTLCIDNGRYDIPFPKENDIHYPEDPLDKNGYHWKYRKESMEYNLGRLLAYQYNWPLVDKTLPDFFDNFIKRVTKIILA